MQLYYFQTVLHTMRMLEKTYAFELGSTEKRINRQPSMGSLFKSQNGTT